MRNFFAYQIHWIFVCYIYFFIWITVTLSEWYFSEYSHRMRFAFTKRMFIYCAQLIVNKDNQKHTNAKSSHSQWNLIICSVLQGARTRRHTHMLRQKPIPNATHMEYIFFWLLPNTHTQSMRVGKNVMLFPFYML